MIPFQLCNIEMDIRMGYALKRNMWIPSDFDHGPVYDDALLVYFTTGAEHCVTDWDGPGEQPGQAISY